MTKANERTFPRLLIEELLEQVGFPPGSGGLRSEHHAAKGMLISVMLARASAGVR